MGYLSKDVEDVLDVSERSLQRWKANTREYTLTANQLGNILEIVNASPWKNFRNTLRSNTTSHSHALVLANLYEMRDSPTNFLGDALRKEVNTDMLSLLITALQT